MFYPRFVKPFFDLWVAIVLLVLLSPLLLLIAGINYCLYGEVFFRQIRTGKNMCGFYFVKFKTMHEQTDSEGTLLPDVHRITGFGRFLRHSSLDELPQLWMVLKGDMSLIGPRPLLPEYNILYNKEQKRRFSVKPGISGWAQVHGRNKQTWAERFALDIYYIEHISFFLDMKTGLLTILQVVKSGDVNASENETMPPFNQ
ncbi:MAG: sugar transferase [Cytophagales bacterium]|nr:sugar transferase [Cytophaga sp.]